MDFHYFTRVKLAITFLVIVLLASNLRQLKETAVFDFSFVGSDEISLYEKRFENLRKSLPSRGVVLYTDDLKGPTERFKAYFLTQYALSPVVLFHPSLPREFYSPVVVSQIGRFVIKNAHDPSREPYLKRLLAGQFGTTNSTDVVAQQKLSAKDRFTLLKDVGNGVALYSQSIQ